MSFGTLCVDFFLFSFRIYPNIYGERNEKDIVYIHYNC